MTIRYAVHLREPNRFPDGFFEKLHESMQAYFNRKAFTSPAD